MNVRFPAYFEDFHCIAGACPDSCCKEWEVLVDEASAARYQAMPGELGDDLRRHLYQEDGRWYFSITDKRCPMWRQDGLCRIQAALGHDALCQTCRDFPRLTHDYGKFIERGLELSCPAAAQLIFFGNGKWTERCIEKPIPDDEALGYDKEDMSLLMWSRNSALEILSEETISVPEALAALLLFAYRTQAALDGGEYMEADIEKDLAFGRSHAKPGSCRDIADFYAGLEILTDTWRSRLASPQSGREWDPLLRKLVIYGVERYWLQAISDFDLVGRVKMVILSCILVNYLGGDLISTAQLYAKEIENSTENVEAILDGTYAAPALTDDKLLGILLL